MEFGHIVLSRGFTSWTSKYIAKFTDSYFSHSFLTAPPMCDRLMAIEATEGGVSAIPFDSGYETNSDEDFIMWELKLPEEVKKAAISKLLDDLERGYGFLEYPWLMWRWICGKFGRDIKKQKNWSDAGIVCSELVVMYLTYCGLGYLFEDFGGEASVVPQDLYKIIYAHPELFVEVKRKIRSPDDKRLIA